MKLEVGMYARTEIGSIGKITKITNENIFFDRQVYRNRWCSNSNTKYLRKEVAEIYIKKASNNIIDLIEVGDYVNGYKVIEVDFDAEEEKYIRVDKSQDGLKTILRLNDIKSIVTKEQFESMSYEVN